MKAREKKWVKTRITGKQRASSICCFYHARGPATNVNGLATGPGASPRFYFFLPVVGVITAPQHALIQLTPTCLSSLLVLRGDVFQDVTRALSAL